MITSSQKPCKTGLFIFVSGLRASLSDTLTLTCRTLELLLTQSGTFLLLLLQYDVITPYLQDYSDHILDHLRDNSDNILDHLRDNSR